MVCIYFRFLSNLQTVLTARISHGEAAIWTQFKTKLKTNDLAAVAIGQSFKGTSTASNLKLHLPLSCDLKPRCFISFMDSSPPSTILHHVRLCNVPFQGKGCFLLDLPCHQFWAPVTPSHSCFFHLVSVSVNQHLCSLVNRIFTSLHPVSHHMQLLLFLAPYFSPVLSTGLPFIFIYPVSMLPFQGLFTHLLKAA